jgi:hypothetical protein
MNKGIQNDSQQFVVTQTFNIRVYGSNLKGSSVFFEEFFCEKQTIGIRNGSRWTDIMAHEKVPILFRRGCPVMFRAHHSEMNQAGIEAMPRLQTLYKFKKGSPKQKTESNINAKGQNLSDGC